MDRTIYQKNLDRNARAAYDARVITKLVRNYRSHEMLIELPNRRVNLLALDTGETRGPPHPPRRAA